jgi:hypothetical protein
MSSKTECKENFGEETGRNMERETERERESRRSTRSAGWLYRARSKAKRFTRHESADDTEEFPNYVIRH